MNKYIIVTIFQNIYSNVNTINTHQIIKDTPSIKKS